MSKVKTYHVLRRGGLLSRDCGIWIDESGMGVCEEGQKDIAWLLYSFSGRFVPTVTIGPQLVVQWPKKCITWTLAAVIVIVWSLSPWVLKVFQTWRFEYIFAMNLMILRACNFDDIVLLSTSLSKGPGLRRVSRAWTAWITGPRPGLVHFWRLHLQVCRLNFSPVHPNHL